MAVEVRIMGCRRGALIAAGICGGLLALLTGACNAGAGGPVPAPTNTVPGTVASIPVAKPSAQLASAEAKKIDSHLQSLLIAYLAGADLDQTARGLGLHVEGGKLVLVDVYVTVPVSEAASRLAELGMIVQATNAPAALVEGLLPVDAILPAARLEFTKALVPVAASGTNDTP